MSGRRLRTWKAWFGKREREGRIRSVGHWSLTPSDMRVLSGWKRPWVLCREELLGRVGLPREGKRSVFDTPGNRSLTPIEAARSGTPFLIPLSVRIRLPLAGPYPYEVYERAAAGSDLPKRTPIEKRNAFPFQLLQIIKEADPSELDPALMPTTDRVIDPDALSEEERSALQKQLRQILSNVEEGEDVGPLSLQVEGEGDWAISLPEAAARPLLNLLSDLAEGRAVSVADVDEELTTREAAELLNVSRPHLTKLLKEGEIPSHKVGSHHRVYRRDVLVYKARRREQSEETMQELTRLSQELGLYD
jgi:excisionase family DNA binding protein